MRVSVLEKYCNAACFHAQDGAGRSARRREGGGVFVTLADVIFLTLAER